MSFLSVMFTSGEMNFRGKHHLPGQAFFIGSKIYCKNLALGGASWPFYGLRLIIKALIFVSENSISQCCERLQDFSDCSFYATRKLYALFFVLV